MIENEINELKKNIMVLGRDISSNFNKLINVEMIGATKNFKVYTG